MHLDLEKFGVTLACNSESPIAITAESMAGLLLQLHLHRSNLAKANELLLLENPTGANERIAEVQAALVGMDGALGHALAELLRVGHEQGLRFHTIADASHH